MKKDRIIKDIVAHLNDNSFSVFCGAGATLDATKTSWFDLFSDPIKNFYRINTDCYLLADLEKLNNRHILHKVVKNLKKFSNYSSEHVNNILRLKPTHIWTTNFDEIIEKTIARNYSIQPNIIISSSDMIYKKINEKFTVFKINGSITSPKTIILTKTDSFLFYSRQKSFFELLKQHLLNECFLFVGYSFQDDLVLQAIRSIQTEIDKKKIRCHYRFDANESKDTQSGRLYNRLLDKYLEKEYNIKTIRVQKFEDIDRYLQEIYDEFCKYNIFICGSFRYICEIKRAFIEQLVDALVKKLYAHKNPQKNFGIYSGNGRGLGEIVSQCVYKYNPKEKFRFVNRPLIPMGIDQNQKNKYNKKIIDDCRTMIIIAGCDNSYTGSVNVKKQYEMFIKNNQNLVIPIPQTEFEAEHIFNSVEFRNTDCYKKCPNLYNKLSKQASPDEIANTVVEIIKSYWDK